jgi:TPR repeat protein
MTRAIFALLSLLPLAAQALAPGAAYAQPAPAAIGQECLRLAAAPLDRGNQAAYEKTLKTWVETCQQAVAANPSETRFKFALSQGLWHKDGRPASLGPLREAAALNDTEVLLEIFNDFNSFDRDLNRPDLIPRAEAEQALRHAAELGNAKAIFRLFKMLTYGGPIKHDLSQARLWAERSLANPPKDMRPSDVAVIVGDLLAQSDNADERARGIALLEPLAKAGRGDAQADMAVAIHRDDPVRARQLLERAVRTYPGSALAPLSDMLIKGEGGPKDEKRALSLLQRAPYDAQHAKWALGQLTLEGRLLPRDVALTVKLLGPWSQWDYDTRLQIVRLLAENPGVQMGYADHYLYRTIEDAELGETGAMDALIALKLSRHVQFADKAGGCALAERAAKRDDAIDARHISECRAK